MKLLDHHPATEATQSAQDAEALIREAKQRERRRRIGFAFAVILVIGVIAALVAVVGGGGPPGKPSSDGGRENQTTPEAVAARRITAHAVNFPFGVSAVYADGSLWLTGLQGGVSRFDPRSGRVENVIALPDASEYPLPMAASDFGSIWVSTNDGQIVRIDAASNTVVARIRVPGVENVAVGANLVWAVSGDEVTAIDPTTNATIGTLNLDADILDLAGNRVGIWMVTQTGYPGARFTVQAIELGHRANGLRILKRISLGAPPVGVAQAVISGSSLWVLSPDGLLKGFSLPSGRTIAKRSIPNAILLGGNEHGIWVVAQPQLLKTSGAAYASEVNKATGKLVGPTVDVGGDPIWLAVGPPSARATRFWVVSFPKYFNGKVHGRGSITFANETR